MNRALISGLLALSACDDPCKAGSDPTLEVGAGLLAFTPITDGDEVALVYGPQGGYHIDLAFRTTYLAAEDLVAGTLLGTVDGVPSFSATPWFQLECVDDVQEATGVRIFLEVPPEDVVQREVAIDVTINDTRGETLTDALVVVPVNDDVLP